MSDQKSCAFCLKFEAKPDLIPVFSSCALRRLRGAGFLDFTITRLKFPAWEPLTAAFLYFVQSAKSSDFRAAAVLMTANAVVRCLAAPSRRLTTDPSSRVLKRTLPPSVSWVMPMAPDIVVCVSR